MFDTELKPDPETRRTSRRTFLLSALTVGGGLYFCYMSLFSKKTQAAEPHAGQPSDQPPKEVTIVEFTDAGERKDAVHVPQMVKTDAEWQQQLTPIAFKITPQDDTEMAFTGKYWNNHDKGL